MPRQARIDAPGTLHHVTVRGIERTAFLRDDADREDFLARVAALAEAGTFTSYAWALLPNHALLLQTGQRPLARSMRSLLTGYAVVGTGRPETPGLPVRVFSPSSGRPARRRGVPRQPDPYWQAHRDHRNDAGRSSRRGRRRSPQDPTR